MRIVELRQPPSGPTEPLEIPENSDEIANTSAVPGATVSAALDTLAGGGGPVTSVFGRSGAVTAQAGDYAASEVSNDSSVAGAGVSGALDTLGGALSALIATVAGLVTGVSSVFGRTGAVAPEAGDYAASQVGNDSSVPGLTVAAALEDLAAAILGLVPSSRLVDTGTGLTGGGDLSADRTISVADGGIGTTQLANDSITGAKIDPIDSTTNQGGPRITFVIPWTGPGAGAGDATLFNANVPFNCRFVAATCLCTVAGAGGSTGTIRTAAGGLGVQVSSAMATASTATKSVDGIGGVVLANQTLAAGSSLFLRLTDGTAAGVLYLDVVRIN